MKMKYCIGFFAGVFLLVSMLGIGYQLSYQYMLDRQEAKAEIPEQKTESITTCLLYTSIRSGIGFVTEDRKGNGLIVDKSLCFNLTLAALDKVRTRRMLNPKKESSLTEKFIKDLGIKSAGMHNPVKSLSGGNQQKVVLAKWLATDQMCIRDSPYLSAYRR